MTPSVQERIPMLPMESEVRERLNDRAPPDDCSRLIPMRAQYLLIDAVRTVAHLDRCRFGLKNGVSGL